MRYVLGLLLLVLVLLQLRLWRGEGSLSDIERLESEIATQAATNAELKKRNDGLLDDVSDLKSGLDSVEEHARSELGLVKKGETYYMIRDREPVKGSGKNNDKSTAAVANGVP
jgi:cell division protein FtsB